MYGRIGVVVAVANISSSIHKNEIKKIKNENLIPKTVNFSMYSV